MILDIAGNVITVVFFLFILSYYALFLIRHRHPKQEKEYRSVTIIIPAHNEEEYIRRSVQSALDAEFAGEKEIIVVDDASRDATPDILESFRKKGVIVLRNRQHSGKSTSLNRALGRAKGDAIAIIDGDSIIERPALQMLVDEVGREKTAAACGAVRVQNRNKFVCMWLHIEVIYNSLIRALFSRINANVVTPGALSVYRKDALDEIGGFSTDGFAEDVDVAIRLHRKGYRINLVENALSDTNMPYDAKGFLRQRFRLARGMVKLLKKHMQLNTTIIDLYTLPLFFFTYVQPVVLYAAYLFLGGVEPGRHRLIAARQALLHHPPHEANRRQNDDSIHHANHSSNGPDRFPTHSSAVFW